MTTPALNPFIAVALAYTLFPIVEMVARCLECTRQEAEQT